MDMDGQSSPKEWAALRSMSSQHSRVMRLEARQCGVAAKNPAVPASA